MDGLSIQADVETRGAPGETMLQYVVRRAREVKKYERVAAATGVNKHWLPKLAIGRITNPNYNDIQALNDFYRRLEQVDDDLNRLAEVPIE